MRVYVQARFFQHEGEGARLADAVRFGCDFRVAPEDFRADFIRVHTGGRIENFIVPDEALEGVERLFCVVIFVENIIQVAILDILHASHLALIVRAKLAKGNLRFLINSTFQNNFCVI